MSWIIYESCIEHYKIKNNQSFPIKILDKQNSGRSYCKDVKQLKNQKISLDRGSILSNWHLILYLRIQHYDSEVINFIIH